VTRIIDWEEVEGVVELGFDRLPEREVKVRLRMKRPS
jgi:hypothetical protein